MDENKEKNKATIDEEQTRLLEKMIERQERDIKLNRVIAFAECALLSVLIFVFSVLLPRFFTTVQKVEESMEEVDVLVMEAHDAMSEVVELVQDADNVVKSNEEAINEAIEHFNSVDFESLNRSIVDIAELIEPVVEFIQRFLK